MSILKIENLVKSYGDKTAVKGIDLEIKKGEFFGFLGHNGAGKTTTISCITGVGRITSGKITVNGYDVETQYRDARRQIGVSPQEYNVDIFGKTFDIIANMGGFYGMNKAEREARTNELIKEFGLVEHAQKKFQALSGGLKRRVMLARAMVHDPDLLILDEPTAGVDVELRNQLWVYLEKINQEGKTIILTSHYLEEVERLCDRIAIIDQGEIIVDKKKEELLSNGENLEQTYLRLTNKSVKN
jgi:ABC-2 type transport system ATP-binding protein